MIRVLAGAAGRVWAAAWPVAQAFADDVAGAGLPPATFVNQVGRMR